MPDNQSWSGTDTNLAFRFCREVYLLTGGNASKWQAVQEVAPRLKLDKPQTQTALKCAVSNLWLETVGNPIFSVRLLDAGHAMFVKENPKLKPRGVPRS